MNETKLHELLEAMLDEMGEWADDDEKRAGPAMLSTPAGRMLMAALPMTDGEYNRPLYSERMAIYDALTAAGLSLPFAHGVGGSRTDWLQHEAANRFHRRLHDLGWAIVKSDPER